MRRKSLLLLALAAAAVLALAACGGDDSGGSEPLTQAEYIAAADAICAEADEKLDALGEPTGEDGLGAFLLEGVAIAEEQVDQLRQLGAPEELSATAERAYELLDQVNEVARESAAAFDDGDLAGGRRFWSRPRRQATSSTRSRKRSVSPSAAPDLNDSLSRVARATHTSSGPPSALPARMGCPCTRA